MIEIPLRYRALIYGLMAIALVTSGFAAAWIWQANAFGRVIASNEAGHQADLASIANAGAAQARAAVEKQQAAEQARAELDAKFTKEKSDALAENDRLRRAVADGSRRLRVAGACSASSGHVSGTASAAGVGDAGTVELAQVAGRNVLDIRAGIIADQSALRALQEYVRASCQPVP